MAVWCKLAYQSRSSLARLPRFGNASRDAAPISCLISVDWGETENHSRQRLKGWERER